MKTNELLRDVLSDLSINERRTLVGYDPIMESEAFEPVLAERFGVGGTDAMISIIQNAELDLATKRNSLSILFGLDEDQINKILPK